MLQSGKQLKDGSVTNAKLATPAGNPTSANKNMTAEVTTTDGSEACATGITSTPINHSMVEVQVNGAAQNLTGTLLGDCYFSADAGVTARALNAITAADKLFWNGSIAGFQLDATDKISLIYNT